MNKTKTVIVISESPRQFDFTASLLRAEGYMVRFAADVDKVLEVAGAETPQLVISELAMPNIDGLKICRQIRRDDNMKRTPILLVGDLSETSSIVTDGRRCGANDYVQKPFTFNVLTDKVMKLLECRSSLMFQI